VFRSVLNPAPRPLATDPLTLSGQLLDAARRPLAEPGAREALEALAGALHGVEPAALAGDEARLAFWLNLYNALTLHALAAYRVRGNLLRHLHLFWRAAYRVGAHRYSLNLIEHGLLRDNARVPPFPFRAARRGDARLAAAPARREPRIHFALNCGAHSCPPIRAYTPERLEAQLALATRAYLEQGTRVEREAGRVVLPGLLGFYAADFGPPEELLRFVARHLPEEDGAWLAEAAGRVRVAYAPYDWTVLPAAD
jgi:hypothetical protein